ncbi:MAG: preprotein translocase subunit YajC [Clostridia bacterium]|nr:preprotein translocase subunit YajC [Clostridia bacterium]
MGLIPMILIFVVFYFILILPQKKQEKKQRSMIDALVPGDEVITIGGIYGNVVSVKDDAIVIESSADKTKIKIAKSSISRCLTVKEEEKK